MAATRVPSRSPLLPLRTLSPGGVAHRPTSLTQSNTAWSQQSTENTDTGFPKSVQQSLDDLTAIISEHGLHTQANSAFPNYKIPSRNPHRLLASWELLSQVISETDTDSTAPNRGCTPIFHAKHRLNSLNDELGYPTEVVLVPRTEVPFRMEERPPLGLLSLFYLHAPGLTLVTLGTACIPSVHLPPTTWELTGPSKKGLRIKECAHGFVVYQLL
jgi:hypothetical protein